MIDLKNNRHLFNDYFKNFDIKNKDILMKFHHSYRVVEFAKDIANSLHLNENQVKLACTCALLHDISRFLQIKLYNTFVDADSFDHGDKSYEILKENNFIDKFTTDSYEQNIILAAIRNHNKLNIEENLTEDEILFSKIIRDADKLDIMIEQSNSIDDGIYNIKIELLNDIYNQGLCSNKYCYTNIDYVLRTISFIFDIHFNYSFKYILNNNIVENKLHLIEANMNIDELKEYVNNYIKNRIN